MIVNKNICIAEQNFAMDQWLSAISTPTTYVDPWQRSFGKDDEKAQDQS
jgi:hypothetical protein